MPFDGKSTDARVNRRILIEALRGEMPEGFTWDFVPAYKRTACGAVGCALGLACELGMLKESEVLDKETVSRTFGVAVSTDIFCSYKDQYKLSRYGGLYARDVTPAMVADALEREPYVE